MPDSSTGSPAIRRVLVTGAAGFIAPHVRAAFERIGVASIGVDRRPEPSVERVADLAEVELGVLLDGVDAVVHLAGTPGVQSSWADGFEAHVRNNLLTTQRLCEAALNHGVQRLVVASSSSVYGEVPDGQVHEDRPLRPLSPYGASKAATEHLLGAYAERGLSVTPLRFFTVYGPGQRADMAFHRMFRAALGGPAFPLRGDGSQARSFTYVEDVAAAVVAATLRSLPSGVPINLGGTEVVSVAECLEVVGRITGSTVPLERLPAAPGDPSRTAADIERARHLLGWSPTTPLADGLARQWVWHRQLVTAPA